MKNFERLIPITIKEAKIKNISIGFQEVEPRVQVEIGLITDDKQMLTSITIDSQNYDEKKRFEVPIEFHNLAGQMEDLLKIAVTQHMNKFQRKIGGNNVDA